LTIKSIREETRTYNTKFSMLLEKGISHRGKAGATIISYKIAIAAIMVAFLSGPDCKRGSMI
jgi:hypothetical protein